MGRNKEKWIHIRSGEYLQQGELTLTKKWLVIVETNLYSGWHRQGLLGPGVGLRVSEIYESGPRSPDIYNGSIVFNTRPVGPAKFSPLCC